jgi:predicted ribosomally synthesized peptide with SipW-like signal peptide
VKKLFGLTIAALLIIGMVGGGTWAYFSDPEASTGNILTAGTLDLKTDDVDGKDSVWTLANMEPGVSTTGEATIVLKNKGSIDGASLDVTFATVWDDYTAAEQITDGLEGIDPLDDTKLTMTSNLIIAVFKYGETGSETNLLALDTGAFVNAWIEAADNAGNNDQIITLDELEAQSVVSPLSLAGLLKNETPPKNFTIKIDFSSDADNDTQGDASTLTINFTLNQ